MNIEINNTEHICDENTSLFDIAEDLGFNKAGTAIAVNMKVITKSLWKEHVLKENDKIIVINATCGG